MSEMIVLLVPLLGTTLGAAMVFLMRNEMNARLEKALLGFAAGVMIAASVWSLLIPSIDMAAEQGVIPWVPALVGFLLGIVFLLLIDTLTPHLHLASGVAFAGAVMGNAGITMAGALALAVGIAIQNFPEGAIISMPLRGEGMSRTKAFVCGVLSGIVEPIGALLTIWLTSSIRPALPYFLSFAAGAMIYVVVEELIPESQNGEHTNIGTIGVAVGFALMMVLDVALG